MFGIDSIVLNEHSNKIIELVTKTNNISERISIAKEYCDKINEDYYLYFRSGVLFDFELNTFNSIDISEYFDIQKIRDKKIKDILNG